MSLKKIMLKCLKWLGILSFVFIVVNIGVTIANIIRTKNTKFEEDLVSTFTEKAFDMALFPTKVNAVSMFSKTTFDYRNVSESDDVYELDLRAMYTGVEVIVPDGWYVESKGRIAMAGMDNTTLTYEDQEARIKVIVDAKFAGISIKNLE